MKRIAPMKRIDRLVPWVVGAFILTVSIFAIYLTAQNLERSGADDAPERLASQVLSNPPADPARVDLATSKAAFWVVYNADGTPTDGNGYLDGELAQLPKGVISTAIARGIDRVTWEPRDGLRFATVEIHDGDRVIAAGQSLEPSESRIDNVGLLLLLGWITSLMLLLIGAVVHLRAGRASD
jgi:hypothetical protein